MGVYQCIVSFNSLLYFQRYAPGKLLTTKIKKCSNSVNTRDRVMALAFCNSPHVPLYPHVPLCSVQKCDDGQTDGRTAATICSPLTIWGA